MNKMSLNELSDFELAGLLKTGSEAAFKVIYERYWRKLYVVAKKRLRDGHEAEEVVQEIFESLWRRRKTFTLTKGFANYFAVAVKFVVIDRMARYARASTFEKEVAQAVSFVDDSTLQRLDYNELQEKFQLTVKALPEKCQIAFRLQHELGYSQKRIADEMEISIKTVEAHLHKARLILRAAFGDLLALVL